MTESRCIEVEDELHDAITAVLDRHQALSDAEQARCVNRAASSVITLVLSSAIQEERDDELRHGPPTGVR